MSGLAADLSLPILPKLALSCLLAPLGLSAGLQASSQLPALHQVTGDGAGDWFGAAIAPAGDLDGDLVPDFMVGAHQNLNSGHSLNPGYARVYSGLDGHLIHSFVGDGTAWIDGPDDHFGYALSALGDLDGDAVPEIIIGAFKDDNVAHNVGMLRIFSGASGALLHQDDGETNGDRMGVSVAKIADLNGDGVDDYMTGVYKDDNLVFNGGSTRVFSGADHALLFTIDGPATLSGLGWSASSAGDVNADGFADIISGAPHDPTSGPFGGMACVHSGADGSLLYTWYGDAAGDYFGHVVDGAGDVNADGHADLLVAAIQSTFTGVATGPGFVRIFSGADGSVLYELSGDEVLDQFGFSAHGVGDVTGDGYDDFLIGAPQAVTLGLVTTGKPGYGRLFSGRDGNLVYTFVGAGANDQFGAAVDVVADMDGDGHPEFLFGASQDDATQSRPGYALVISGGLVLMDRYCTAAPNSAGAGAQLDHSGSLSVSANDVVLRATDCPPQHFGLFYYGSNAISVPFGDGFRCVGGQTFRLGVASTGFSGTATLALDLANQPQAGAQINPGSRWNFQFWYRDIPAAQSGFNLSNAVSAAFAP
ncbi:MAG: integrin alpha [bacterium]|nr:hypothetical protein [Planctomycetota bacterium]HIL52382.1 hypothetical protein [Planctomycetota bacterium]